MSAGPLLSVRDLRVDFHLPDRRVSRAVDGVDFDLSAGETLALVGESGSGKSVTAFSISRLLPRNARHPSGTILFEGRDVLAFDAEQRRQLRGGRIGMIFQEPGTSLNPVIPVGRQVEEALRLHRGLRARAARDRVVELFSDTGIPEPARRCGCYPHELSGGMKQRVMIAMAMACEPALLIADEPTTALDVTIQAQILELMRRLQQKTGMAILLITHNLGIVHDFAPRVVVMRRGKLVESGATATVLRAPAHEYTRRLLDSLPERMARPESAPVVLSPGAPVVEVTDLKVWYPVTRGLLRKTVDHVKAVDGVSFSSPSGGITALVGESGCGKTTAGKALLRLTEPTAGRVRFEGKDWLALPPAELRRARRRMQLVFQDPAGSMNPRMRVRDVVGEGLRAFNLVASDAELDERVCQALREVELDPETRLRFPHEFSGGQRQRVCLARALAVDPAFLVLDEATSALDVSVQADILRLLLRLRRERGLAMLFITHDLSVVRYLADQVLVMHRGRAVEEGPTAAVFDAPREAYTQRLLDSAPRVPSP